MRARWRYAITGVLLGLGAPLGSALLKLLLHPDGGVLPVLLLEWRTGTYYYVYMALGTTLAFGAFGFRLGQLNEDLNALSQTDGLTGVWNHRHLQEQLTRETQRADRYTTPLTCLMMDIDNFKAVNDRHGHIFGDAVLRGIAKTIQESVRQTDCVGRYGGEEFLVLMPQTDRADAAPLAERIHRNIRGRLFQAGSETVHVTLSIGLATYPDPEHGVKTRSALLSAVDQALYQAKRAGKNQTVNWRA